MSSSKPTPALVTQSQAQPVPAWLLYGLCLAYSFFGFVGKGPWRGEDLVTLGYVRFLLQPDSNWLHPWLVDQVETIGVWLPYWLSAWSVKLLGSLIDPLWAIRAVFITLMLSVFWAIRQSTYALAKLPEAQPLPLAFGGHALSNQYARTLADASVLGLLATLGLAQLSHETGPAVVQLFAVSWMFYGFVYRRAFIFVLANWALALSGGVLFASIATGIALYFSHRHGYSRLSWSTLWFSLLALVTLALSTHAWSLDLRLGQSQATKTVGSLVVLFIWFFWPTSFLAGFTIWRWRRQLSSLHLAWPLSIVILALALFPFANAIHRSLLLATPPLAVLATFALPTLKRQMSAWIDWFSLLFFSACALIIWIVWFSMHAHVPAQPLANVQRLLPGFEPSFSLIALLVAAVASAAWVFGIRWRTASHPKALWKSLLLPAAGASLNWLLLMTLWLPILNFARSYESVANQLTQLMHSPSCVYAWGLSRSQLAALEYHAHFEIEPIASTVMCPYLIVHETALDDAHRAIDLTPWHLKFSVHRPSDAQDELLVFERVKHGVKLGGSSQPTHTR